MKIMGVINLTPDSFSDGGDFFGCKPDHVVARAEQLIEDGADLIDFGAESTRPGADFLSVEEEWERLVLVLSACLRSKLHERAILSIDTNKPEIMRRSLDFGVGLINNILGLTDAETLSLLARHKVSYLAMHTNAAPATMMEKPLDPECTADSVSRFFREGYAALKQAGFDDSQIWLDPGVGFGKSDPAILRMFQLVPAWSAHHQIAIGISRKSFFGRLLGIRNPRERDLCSKVAEVGLFLSGAKMIRTHDVRTLAQLRLSIPREQQWQKF